MSNTSNYQNESLRAALQQTQHLFIHADRLTSKTFVSQGGYGRVYKANLHPASGSRNIRIVAVKELIERESVAKVENLLQALFREILPWARLRHPNVIPFIGYSFDGRTASLISSWYSNGSVDNYIKTHRDVDRRKLVLEVARGLEYLHTQDPPVIHGDLKAENVFVDDAGVAMVGDFGLAKFAAGGPTGLSGSSGFHGTPRWASPEVFSDSPNTPASDVWAFACVVGEILCSKKPFSDIKNEIAVIAELIGPNFSSDSLYRDIPHSHPLRDILKDCWSSHWSDRPPIGEVRERLENVPVEDWVLGNPSRHSSRTNSLPSPIDERIHQVALERYELLGDLRQEGKFPKALSTDSALFSGWWTPPGERPQKVAIKYYLHREEETTMERLDKKRAAKEIVVRKDLQHPNILPLLGCRTEPRACVVSPWCENGTITQYLTTQPHVDKLLLVYQIANALTYLHNRRPAVIHGNLTPSNILINDREEAVISGFRLSMIEHSWQEEPSTSAIDLPYTAPELLLNASVASTASDVYAFAMLAIKVLSGRRPYHMQGFLSTLLMKTIAAQHPMQADHPFSDSLSLWPLFERCWEKSPEHRPSMIAVRDELRRSLLAKGSWHWLNGPN